jgi:hypothetical protein
MIFFGVFFTTEMHRERENTEDTQALVYTL